MVRRRRARRALDRRTSANKATALTQARLSPCADEYEAFRKAAIEDVTSSYKDLRREETELAREQKEVLQAIKDFLKRSETARKNVQKTSSSAKDACTLVLQCAALSNRLPRPAISTRSLARARTSHGASHARRKHEKKCTDTVQKTIKKVRAVRARRLPLHELKAQVVAMTDEIEKDLE